MLLNPGFAVKYQDAYGKDQAEVIAHDGIIPDDPKIAAKCFEIQSPLPPHLQPCGQQRQTHLRQQLAEAECARLQGTEAEIRSDLRRRQIPDKDRETPSQ